MNKVLKHLRDEETDDDILARAKRPRYNIYMNNSYSASGSKDGIQITIEDTKNNNKNPPQIYLKPREVIKLYNKSPESSSCVFEFPAVSPQIRSLPPPPVPYPLPPAP